MGGTLTALLVVVVQVGPVVVVRAGRGGGRERRAVHGERRALDGRGVARRHQPAAAHGAAVAARAVTAAPIVPAAHDLLEQKLFQLE